jgi:flagellar motility protein MotE (MotC chaperone)
MPTGIILSSGSVGAKQEDIEKVLRANGYEPEKPEAAAAAEVAEPKREDFASDEAFEAAQEEHEAEKAAAEEQAAETAEEKAEREEQERENKKPLSRRQKAIERATRELREENRKLAERLAKVEGKEKPELGKEPEAPKRENFKSDAEYEDALFDHRYKLRRTKEALEEQKKAYEQRLAANFEDYKTSAAEFREKHDDWDEVVNSSVSLPEAVYYAIVDLGKDGPRVTYHLAKNRDLIDTLAEMTPYRAAMEIGRLADKLKPGSRSGQKPAEAAGAARTPNPKPRIPAPVEPVRSAARSSTLTSAEAAKQRDFRAFKQAQRAGR